MAGCGFVCASGVQVCKRDDGRFDGLWRVLGSRVGVVFVVVMMWDLMGCGCES